MTRTQTQEPPVRRADETISTRDSTALLVRLVLVHAVVVAIPALVVLVILLTVLAGVNMIVPIVLALALGAGATAWRMRSVDVRIARQIGAQPVGAVGEQSDRRMLRLQSLVESVAMAAGIAAPRLHLIDTPARNAMTWGASNSPPSMAVTSGLLESLDRVEMESVLAHQATMVNDRPVDVITLGAWLFGPLAKGPLSGPVARFIHTNTDPRSIVLSDIEGARATRYPPGMVAALEKLLGQDTLVALIPEAFSGLCFVTPVPETGPFALHPPLEDRIDLMREI